MNLYLPNGYLDVGKILAPKQFWMTVMVGPRGTGKSYGVLEHLTITEPLPYFYIRTKQKEIDLMKDPDLYPFTSINMNHNANYFLKKKLNEVSMITKDPESNDPIALVAALSTIADVRGMDARKYKVIFYDEFIPEKHVRKMRNQGTAVKQMYETLNRNRELEGEDPMKLILCANSEDIANDVLVEYKLIDHFIDMQERGLELKDLPDRGIRLVFPMHSPISEKKKNTAAYRSDHESAHSRMALNNEFTSYYKGNIKSMNLQDFEPKVIVGELCIYKSKSNKILYISKFRKGNFVEVYRTTDFELNQFRLRHARLVDYYFKNKIKFENASCEIEFQNIFQR